MTKLFFTFFQKKPTMRRPNLMVGGSDEHFRIGESCEASLFYHRKPLNDGYF